MCDFVQNELTDQNLQQEVVKEFVMTLLVDQKLEQGKFQKSDEFAGGSKK